MNPLGLVSLILALQFAVFGWRISREIALGEEDRKTWLLVCDYINLTSMLSVVGLCIIVPLAIHRVPRISEICIAVAAVLIVFYPIILAGHYRLFSKQGRSIYLEKGKDVPYLTDQEIVALSLSLICAVIAGYFVGR